MTKLETSMTALLFTPGICEESRDLILAAMETQAGKKTLGEAVAELTKDKNLACNG